MPFAQPPFVTLLNAPAYVAAPIVGARRTIGFLYADVYERGRPPDEIDRDRLGAFAEGLGYAIEHTMLYERVHAARELTQGAWRSIERLLPADTDVRIESGMDRDAPVVAAAERARLGRCQACKWVHERSDQTRARCARPDGPRRDEHGDRSEARDQPWNGKDPCREHSPQGRGVQSRRRSGSLPASRPRQDMTRCPRPTRPDDVGRRSWRRPIIVARLGLQKPAGGQAPRDPPPPPPPSPARRIWPVGNVPAAFHFQLNFLYWSMSACRHLPVTNDRTVQFWPFGAVRPMPLVWVTWNDGRNLVEREVGRNSGVAVIARRALGLVVRADGVDPVAGSYPSRGSVSRFRGIALVLTPPWRMFQPFALCDRRDPGDLPEVCAYRIDHERRASVAVLEDLLIRPAPSSAVPAADWESRT